MRYVILLICLHDSDSLTVTIFFWDFGWGLIIYSRSSENPGGNEGELVMLIWKHVVVCQICALGKDI